MHQTNLSRETKNANVATITAQRLYYPPKTKVLVIAHDFPAEDVPRLTVPTLDLRKVLMSHAQVDLVGFVPDNIGLGAELGLVEKAATLAHRYELIATLRPVTDAVKQIKNGELVRTIDRSTLNWAIGPAFISAKLLRESVLGVRENLVMPIRTVRHAFSNLSVGNLTEEN